MTRLGKAGQTPTDPALEADELTPGYRGGENLITKIAR